MYRFFKCNILGGFRVSDLNKNIKQGEYFFVESSFCETSRATKVAIDSKWMTEVSEKEASQFISIPKQINTKFVMSSQVGLRSSNKLAIPDVKETNKKIESRQAERTRKQPIQKQKDEEKPIIPDFNAAERNMRIRQADVMSKGCDEVLKSPIEAKKEYKKLSEENSVQINDFSDEKIVDEQDVKVSDFSNEKIEVIQEIEKKVRRRKRSINFLTPEKVTEINEEA